MIQRASSIAANGMYKALKSETLEMDCPSNFVNSDDMTASYERDFDYYSRLDKGLVEGDLDPLPGKILQIFEGIRLLSDGEGDHRLPTQNLWATEIQGTSKSGSIEHTRTASVDGDVESVTKTFLTTDQERTRLGVVGVDQKGWIQVGSYEANRGDTGFTAREWNLQ